MFVQYDSTFDGLLSAAAWCFRQGVQPDALISELDPLPIVQTVPVAREPNIRDLFRRHLTETLGSYDAEMVMDIVFKAFLSETCDIATAIGRFLELALKTRSDPSGQLCHPAVAAVTGAAKRAGGQAHQFLGLLRFRNVGNELYVAEFAPDCHVLPLILPHFCDRLADQQFVICDRRRNLAALHQPDGRVSIHILADELTADQPTLPGTATALALPHAADDGYAPMWQRYLKHLTIPERRNLELQQAHMPKKYWKYLVEFD